jgi:biopolymer transport protein ExbD
LNFRGASKDGARRRGVVVDMTALIDVVFQLLIFFLLTSSFVSSQAAQAPQVPVDLPETSLEAKAHPHEQFNIVVTSDGEVVINGSDKVGLEELATRLLKLKADTPRTVVLIRGDQSVPYGRVAQVMAVIRTVNLPVSAVLQNAN